MTTIIRQPADPFRADVLRGERSPLWGEIVRPDTLPNGGQLAEITEPASRAFVAMVKKHQRSCIVCGNGLLVQPWGEIVKERDRIIMHSVPWDGDAGKDIYVHAYCLLEAGAGRRISDALGLTEEEV